jgi:hypothetical protein
MAGPLPAGYRLGVSPRTTADGPRMPDTGPTPIADPPRP